MDIVESIGAINRQVVTGERDGRATRVVVAERSYPSPPEYLATGASAHHDESVPSPELITFMRLSSDDWCRASIEAGTPADEARAAADRTIAAYTGG